MRVPTDISPTVHDIIIHNAVLCTYILEWQGLYVKH